MKRFLVVDGALGAHPEVRAWTVDRVRTDQDLLRTHGLQPHDAPWQELHWLTVDDRVDAWFDPVSLVGVFSTELAWDFDRSRANQIEPPGIKQLSFLHKARGCTNEDFVVRYRAHVPEALRHMPGLWRYQQNQTVPLPHDDGALYGISELWFASVNDFCNLYWAAPENQVEEHAEVSQFLSSHTWSVLTTEEIRDRT